MALAFLETPRFPDNVAYGSGGGPEFKTRVFEGNTAIEQRHQVWSRARSRYDVSYGIRDTTDMDMVRAFFYACRGKATGFRFKDWADYQMDQELIGTGDGTADTFTFKKTYTQGALSYERRIFKPISGTVVVRVNDVVTGSGFTIDYTTGTIVFLTPPTNGHTIKITCEFDVPVRFDTDYMAPKHDGFESEAWGSIPLVEVMIDDTDP